MNIYWMIVLVCWILVQVALLFNIRSIRETLGKKGYFPYLVVIFLIADLFGILQFMEYTQCIGVPNNPCAESGWGIFLVGLVLMPIFGMCVVMLLFGVIIDVMQYLWRKKQLKVKG